MIGTIFSVGVIVCVVAYVFMRWPNIQASVSKVVTAIQTKVSAWVKKSNNVE